MPRDIVLCDGKYRFFKDDRGILRCTRHGEVWRDFLGDNAVTALFDYCEEIEHINSKALDILQNGLGVEDV